MPDEAPPADPGEGRENTCGNCQYWDPHGQKDRSTGLWLGSCHYHAPAPHPDWLGLTPWPVTTENDFCADWDPEE